MAFSCARLVSNLREGPEENVISTEPKNRKRPCPFSSYKEEHSNTSEDVVPEAIDVLDDIFESLCSFAEHSVIETSDVEVANKHPVVTNLEISSGSSAPTDKNLVIETNDSSTKTDAEHKDIFDFTHIPLQVTGAWEDFKTEQGNNYTRGCKWAPDGSCILTCSDDNILRLFNLPHELWDISEWQNIPEMKSVIDISEGELVLDFCWYPLMNSSDPNSCCLASCSRNSPVHLWDAFTGELRCTYRTYDQMDEIVAARSLSFDADGQRLFCGFDKIIRIFNVDIPGRNWTDRPTFAKKSGQSGIISCFAFTSANRNISAAGSYNKTIGIYSEPDGNLECLVEGQKGGLTHLQFSPDGNFLYSGGRKDPEILCWDLRNLGTVLYSLRRSCSTNQRMYFDISSCGRYVISGNNNGVISIWDTLKEPKEVDPDDFLILEPAQFFLAHDDCVNGISIHPTLPFLCSSSGQRKFPALLPDDDDDMFSFKVAKQDNSLRLWWVGKYDA